MRLNQLLHIQLRDVNVDKDYIDLRLEGSKTHSEWRVPVVQQLRLRLSMLLVRFREAGAGSSDLLFDVRRFIPALMQQPDDYDPAEALQKLRSFFRRLSNECGFSVSPPRFRHTLATELMKTPERNLQLVQDLLGHRSVSTTMESVELKMDIVGKTLEDALTLYTNIYVERDLQILTVS